MDRPVRPSRGEGLNLMGDALRVESGAYTYEGIELGLVELFGELELESAYELESALLPGNWESFAAVVVDFTDLEFIDSSGLLALLKGTRRLTEGGKRVVMVVAEGSAPERVLRLTAVGAIFPIVATRDGVGGALAKLDDPVA